VLRIVLTVAGAIGYATYQGRQVSTETRASIGAAGSAIAFVVAFWLKRLTPRLSSLIGHASLGLLAFSVVEAHNHLLAAAPTPLTVAVTLGLTGLLASLEALLGIPFLEPAALCSLPPAPPSSGGFSLSREGVRSVPALRWQPWPA
jgi:hypothetical protein